MTSMAYKPWRGRPMRMMPYEPDDAKRETNDANLSVRNIPKTLSERELFERFSKFGCIVGMKIQCDEHGFSYGYAYVHFEQEANAKTATANLHNTSLQGKKIVVEQFKSKREHEEEQRRQARANNSLEEYYKRTVFVNNLHWDVRRAHLEDFFGWDEAESSSVAMRENGQSRGYGFVTFRTIEQAEEALECHGRNLLGRELYMQKFQTKWQRLATNSASSDTETAIASAQGGQILGLTGHNESIPDSAASVLAIDPLVAETTAPATAKVPKQKKAQKQQRKRTVLQIQPKSYGEIRREERGEQGRGRGRGRGRGGRQGHRHQEKRTEEQNGDKDYEYNDHDFPRLPGT